MAMSERRKAEGKEKVGGEKERIGVRETDRCHMRGCLSLGRRVIGWEGRKACLIPGRTTLD